MTDARPQQVDPDILGLLVSPARMILEPGQRRLVRVAAIAPRAETERVYRLKTSPIAGQLSAETSGLKILVGYDVLVLVRPSVPRPQVVGTRGANEIDFRNTGNVSVELIDGRQCDSSARSCTELPAKRLYAGAQWAVPVAPGTLVEYTLKSPAGATRKRF